MLFSVISNFLKFVLRGLGSQEEDECNSDEEEVKEILNKISNFRDLSNDHLAIIDNEELLGGVKHDVPGLKTDNYVYQTGVITYLGDSYGLIDGHLYFDLDCITPNLYVKKDDEVSYLTLKESSPDGAPKILKITSASHCSWGKYDTKTHKFWGKEFEAVHRVITGRVTTIEQRKFLIHPHNIWCNMEKVHVSFIPVEGDWVSMEASVSLNDQVIDWEGEVFDIMNVKPMFTKSGSGRISFWTDGRNEGVIDGVIYFKKNVCTDMYFPSLGDLVTYEALESEQGKFKLRALWIKPDKLKLRERKEKKLFMNKKGVVITQSLSVIDLGLNETKEVILEVINRGTANQTITKTRIRNMKDSLLSLKSPNLNDQFTLKPKDRIKYVVTCSGKCLGSKGEIFEFQFEKFRIAKSLEINVLTDDCIKELSTPEGENIPKEKKIIRRMNGSNSNELVLYGAKPFITPRFNEGPKKKNYDIPPTLWKIMLEPGNIPKSNTAAMRDLRKNLPFLGVGLDARNYSNRFHTLLHLEEVGIRLQFTKYEMNEVILDRKGEYLVLKVPGLTEGRPSIIPGDRILLTRPWPESNSVVHMGFVHKVGCNDLFINFHFEFQKLYNGEKCDIKFVPNMGSFVKCHQAVDRALTILGKEWLFPSTLIDKPDMVDFEIADGPVEEEPNKDLPLNDDEEKKNTLVWYNKNLNERQKMAVVNVLKGKGRPMPYVLFGPPGTGKTTTVVEMVIQVSALIPESRLLISGPSNSFADLIAEKLIDSRIFKPGELVRLYALNRAQDGNISDKLMPYSTCFHHTGKNSNNTTESIIKGSKITIGTFSALGDLHGSFSFNHRNHNFTHIFIDEAAQMTEPEILIPASFLHKESGVLVLAGDPKQLGPVCTSTIAAKFDLDISLMERLLSFYPYRADRKAFPENSGYDPRVMTKLNCNYRSLPEIISLPNQLFYDSDLIPMISEDNSQEAEYLKRIDINLPKRTKTPAIIFHGIMGKNLQEKDSPSWYNPQEIWQAVIYLKKIYRSGLTADDVGIVTPYSKQVHKFRQVFESLNLAIPKIGTVNNFQGQEKHVIILSTVRSCIELMKKDVMNSLGFVACPRRLNVAVTRARTLLIILGNPNLLGTDPYWERVIDYCLKNNSYVGCNMKCKPKTEMNPSFEQVLGKPKTH